MAKRGRDRRQPHRAATRPQRAPRAHTDSWDPNSQPLVAGLRESLRSPNPTDFLLAASALVEALTSSHGSTQVTLADLVDSFVDIEIAETTAALHAIAALVPDELMAARLSRVLSTRRQPVPDMVRGLADVTVTAAVLMHDPLGDGDDVLLGLTWPSGSRATFLVYIDHNLGTLVKDAFLIPETDEAVVERLREIAAEQGHDPSFVLLDVADARARLTEALDADPEADGAPPTETWPACRPLLTMLMRGMPEGGVGHEWPELGDQEAQDLADEFLGSPEGLDLDLDQGEVDDDIAAYLVDFVRDTMRGANRWSPVSVEIALISYFASSVAEPPEVLERVPSVLRQFIRFAHRLQRVDPRLTSETLAAVDRWQRPYEELVNDPHIRRSREVLRELALLQTMDSTAWARALLVEEVGSQEALAALGVEPLPDEEIDWAAVPEDVHPRVQEVAELVDRFADEVGGVELRTACRRFLGRAASNDPEIFRRRSRADTGAAAVAWVIAKANGMVGYYPAAMSVTELQKWFGVGGSPSGRAEAFLKANGVDPYRRFGEMHLGAPDLLVSAYRARLVKRRDLLADPVET
ncbi:MAG: DUF6398 domain-containing protein [Actinomycetota bacterium]|nr:DUF6398 domain-containing protein [Actinomycetota bacterium]